MTASRAAVDPVILDYYSPCAGRTLGKVSTWHGKNRDGRPPYDPNRRTYDFRCVDETVYAPHVGEVWGVTPKYGGVVLIQDFDNKACMIFLGMRTILVTPRQIVDIGTVIGTYRIFHFTAVDGTCADANWYDVAARERERPIQFLEFGEVIAPDIRRPTQLEFTSLNPMNDAPQSLQPQGMILSDLLYVGFSAESCVDSGECECGSSLRAEVIP